MARLKKGNKRTVVMLSVLSAFLLLCILVLSVIVFRLGRTNLFSKNIVLSDSWLLQNKNQSNDADDVNEFVSVPAEFAAEYENLFEKKETLKDYQDEVDYSIYMLSNALYSKVISVPHIMQGESLPNGCEAVSATMLLQYNHFSVTAEEFVSAHLPCEPVRLRWGCRYGPDPSVSYAGDPHSKRGGFGCFAPVIVKALQSYLPQSHRVVNLTGKTLQEIAVTYIAADIPVAVWVTQDMTPIEKAYQWQSYDKTESFLYPVNQHCMVFCGFDREYYYFSDPLSEESLVKYPRATAEEIYRSMGQQAVAVFQSDQNAQ